MTEELQVGNIVIVVNYRNEPRYKGYITALTRDCAEVREIEQGWFGGWFGSRMTLERKERCQPLLTPTSPDK